MASKDLLQSKAEKALKSAVHGVLEDHKRTGRPVVIWRNGKVARVPAGPLLKKKKKGAVSF